MSDRLLGLNQLIRKELSQIILREADFPKGILVTLTRVECSQNLNEAKVYISVLPEQRAGEMLQILNREIYHLQQLLNKRLRMRPIPKIIFVEEKKTVEAGKIEELLEKIYHG